MFIDGIDTRPSDIDQTDYLQCIKGLNEAMWELNNDFFPNIKGSKGHFKIVLLIRPDIINSLGVHNLNSKLRDNAVILQWTTVNNEYKESGIYELANHIFMINQITKLDLDYFSLYFPFEINLNEFTNNKISPFIQFLRLSYHRPRDFIQFLKLLKDNFKPSGNTFSFSERDLKYNKFLRDYSEYLLSEIKDQMGFYFTPEDFEKFRRFFHFLNGAHEFKYSEYLHIFDIYVRNFEDSNEEKPDFCKTADDFLQLLYDLNVIGYIETDNRSDSYIRWCFRERSQSDLHPKIRKNAKYVIHYGLRKSLHF